MNSVTTRRNLLVAFRRYTSKTNQVIDAAFSERLRKLEEENTIDVHDKLLGSEFKSLIDQDPQLHFKQQKLKDKKFQYENQRVLANLNFPSNVTNNQARDIAMSEPWTGQEPMKATALRMLEENNKPLKINSDVKKLSSAKTTILEHKLCKSEETKLVDEDSKFKEIYAERFTPIGSFDKIMTIADARIEKAMREGQFKTVPRGNKLHVEIGTYVDRTEHHLNNVLIKQNVTPPWIERQGETNSNIRGFKIEFLTKFKNHVRHFYDEDHSKMIQEFHRKWRQFFEDRLNIANQGIRNYNLQAPLSTQKFYMTYEREFERMIASVNLLNIRELHVDSIKREALQKKIKEQEEAKIGNRLRKLKFWEKW